VFWVRHALKRVVLIPTYNEAENIRQLVLLLHDVAPGVDVIIIDDGSPDGTGRIAEEAGATEVIHRQGKQGLGTAYIAGFARALALGYEQIAQMDADFSHPPDVLPKLFETLDDFDVAIGSRYVPGGGTRNWGVHRKLLSSTANQIARQTLSLKAHDVTSGFRAYWRQVIEGIDFTTLESQGYSFQVELQYRCENRGFTVGEVPIIFADREVGTSKMSMKEIRGGVANLVRLRMKRGR